MNPGPPRREDQKSPVAPELRIRSRRTAQYVRPMKENDLPGGSALRGGSPIPPQGEFVDLVAWILYESGFDPSIPPLVWAFALLLGSKSPRWGAIAIVPYVILAPGARRYTAVTAE